MDIAHTMTLLFTYCSEVAPAVSNQRPPSPVAPPPPPPKKERKPWLGEVAIALSRYFTLPSTEHNLITCKLFDCIFFKPSHISHFMKSVEK